MRCVQFFQCRIEYIYCWPLAMALAECLRCMYMPPLLLAVDRSQEFKLPWPTSNRPCAKCPCNVTDMPWADVSDHAC